MTEIPEHLLKRSKAAKGKGGDDDAAPAAAASSSVTPAKADPVPSGPPAIAAAAAAIPKDSEPEPAKPESEAVQRARKRNRIPMWALVLVFFLPIWAISFAGTMQLPPTEDLLFIDAAEAFSTCASCHGASGGGGVGYQLSGGSVLETFPDPIDQMVHVARGSTAINGEAYGAERADGQRVAGTLGNMPAHAGTYSLLELELVVFHERAILSEEDTTGDAYLEWMDDMRERIESGEDIHIDVDSLLACADPMVTPGGGGEHGEDCPGPQAEEG